MIVREAEYDVGDIVLIDELWVSKKDVDREFRIISKSKYGDSYIYGLEGNSYNCSANMLKGRKICEVKEVKVILGKFFGDVWTGIWTSKDGQKITPAKLEKLDDNGGVVWIEDAVNGRMVPENWIYSEEADSNQLTNNNIPFGKVMIRPDLHVGMYDGGVNVVGDMLEYAGELAVIVSSIGGDLNPRFRLDVDEGEWNWSRGMLLTATDANIVGSSSKIDGKLHAQEEFWDFDVEDEDSDTEGE